jgi:hypothetical protein
MSHLSDESNSEEVGCLDDCGFEDLNSTEVE